MSLRIDYIKIEELKPYKNNAKIHTTEQIEQIKKSIKDYGMNDPIGVWKDNTIIEGHGRLEACKQLGYEEVPIIRLENLTDEERRAYTIIHNQTTMNTGFNIELLNNELEDITIDLSDYGVENFKLDELEETKEIVEDEIPEIEEDDIKSKLGDIYKLGNHILMCGDSTNEEDVNQLINGNKVDLVFTDPPYGMKKEKDGVTNDNLNYEDLLKFNEKWISITFKKLKDNGSWYCWGIDEPLMDIYASILKPMIKNNKITFRNLITWYKGDVRGQLSDKFRSYPRADEKCLFVMKGVQDFNNNVENYYERWEPIRSYLETEAKKVGLNYKKVKEITNTEMWKHWFTKSQFTLITEKHYLQLQDYYKGEAFKKEYEEIKKEYEETRAYFNNTHDNMNNVWHFDRTSGEERKCANGHATPKPIALCTRAIKSSSRENENVLDLFGGSGSTLIACEQNNRNAYVIELEPKWVDTIIKRWENFTGKKAIKLN